jgi:uncharacterized glyoxalase superfamily protein PhnB
MGGASGNWNAAATFSILGGMKFGYTILYVADVPATVSFYERAFGLARRFVHESNLYAEMETGSTTLAFAGDPNDAYLAAISAGASAVKPPVEKPWGQTVGYVRDLNGCLVEICSPIAPWSATNNALELPPYPSAG